MIKEFTGKYEFLSNFWHSPFEYEGITYPTNEHFFQAMKSQLPAERKIIAAAVTPGQAKRFGRQCVLRPDWERVKDEVMLTGLRIKFSNPTLRTQLIMTGDEELVEGNWWGDTYWGVCNGVGKNRLGKLLMQVREEIKLELN